MSNRDYLRGAGAIFLLALVAAIPRLSSDDALEEISVPSSSSSRAPASMPAVRATASIPPRPNFAVKLAELKGGDRIDFEGDFPTALLEAIRAQGPGLFFFQNQHRLSGLDKAKSAGSSPICVFDAQASLMSGGKEPKVSIRINEVKTLLVEHPGFRGIQISAEPIPGLASPLRIRRIECLFPIVGSNDQRYRRVDFGQMLRSVGANGRAWVDL